MIKIGLLGYSGRMGKLIADEIAATQACTLAGGTSRGAAAHAPKDGEPLFSPNAKDVIAASDVIIDFTVADATAANAALAAEMGKPLMCGTTGISPEALEALRQAAKKTPVLYAPNTSLSLAATKQIVTLASKLLANFDYDVAILDEHHRMKKDAPSGTAIVLGEAAIKGNGGQKQPSYAAIRAGHIVGEHDVLFAGQGESIRIHHSVTDRRIFARGALQAALWLYGKPKGFYGMDDVLGM